MAEEINGHSLSEAMQRHHDYYVRLEKAGVLPPEDQANLDLAKKREIAGEVKPLTPTEPAGGPITGKVEGQGPIKPAGGK